MNPKIKVEKKKTLMSKFKEKLAIYNKLYKLVIVKKIKKGSKFKNIKII